MTINEKHRELVATARTAGVLYLAMAVSGILGFLIFHPQVFDSEDSQKTLTKLIDLESLARTRLLFEFAIVVSQAITAVWFYKLFRHINEWAAWTVGIWGMINSIAIMISAISMGSAIEIASSSQNVEDKLILIELLSSLITNSWGVGGLFFGLWLIPLGYIITSSKKMPVWLGRTLIIGGIGYLLSTVANYVGIKSPVIDYLTIPATIGEFWMIGYLLIYGIRQVNE
ncbi:DUF4386 domain-containing protein [Subsaximicrobium wynnwilliamsii]|uniref:DUF4386 domain-containing protein n=1 Tax=Subsaximicrobium wynnwilliamsii TaxID=291179 RepID=A0A5C6ZB01_9FLAO|nr:DUF4386 domain-containing protein [Subsaximicrobium wynnwilliamsii]TXD80708.1 DUF4386 domain-containing protein [Subsaximicrobium wynnwilliamsii]TXD86387.1 DUF4386 domain-containing protein [Subsaximicrobium wynnwilliamsii]TXD99934.1 DUF4386 domain-containing protein [Subsaximicrobium wynnwilliamsii]